MFFRPKQRGGDRSRSEDGAVLVIVGVMIAVLIAVAAFAVDIGMQRVARRDMQAVADAVALDLGRLVDGRAAQEVLAGGAGKPGLEQARAWSVDRNDDASVGDAPTITVVLVKINPLTGRPETDPDGSVHVVTGLDVPDAVHVTASTSVDFAFATGSGGASRTAMAGSESVACFQIGSFAARLDPENSALLDGLLSDAFDVEAVSYVGLADASLSLGELSAELGAFTVDEVADLQVIEAQTLLGAAATVMQNDGAAMADVTVMQSLAAKVGSVGVDIADIFALAPGSTSAMEGRLNALDLVAATAFAANGENALGVDVVWNEPMLSSGPVSLRVIERAQVGCGRAGEVSAETAQLRLDATIPLHVPQILGLSASSSGVVIDVDVAGASGRLTDVRCGQGTDTDPDRFDMDVETDLANLNLTAPIQLTGEINVRVSDLGLSVVDRVTSGLGLNTKVAVRVEATVLARATTSYGGSPAPVGVTYAVPPQTYGRPMTVGTTNGVALPQVTLQDGDISGTASVTLPVLGERPVALTSLGINAELTSRIVEPALNPLIENLNETIVPLSQLLGLHLTGADVQGLEAPVCDSPALRG